VRRTLDLESECTHGVIPRVNRRALFFYKKKKKKKREYEIRPLKLQFVQAKDVSRRQSQLASASIQVLGKEEGFRDIPILMQSWKENPLVKYNLNLNRTPPTYLPTLDKWADTNTDR